MSAFDADVLAEDVVVGVEESEVYTSFEDAIDEAVREGAVQPRISPAERGALRGRIGS